MPRRPPLLESSAGDGRRRVGLGGALGAALGEGATTSATTTWMPLLELPLVMTGTPSVFRHVSSPFTTSAVTT